MVMVVRISITTSGQMKSSRSVPLLIVLVIYTCAKADAWILRRRPYQRQCEVSSWSSWSECVGGCGGGQSIRTREIAFRGILNRFTNCQPPKLEEGRNCPGYPCPIHCAWGEWSSWTECDPCRRGRKSRVRRIVQPAMFGGEICKGSEFSVSSCLAANPCNNAFSCESSSEYACRSRDECVPKYLACNGDADCRDQSDEYNCNNNTRDVCSGKKYPKLPNGYVMGSGYDILRDSVSGQVLDNEKYQGVCETIYVPEVKTSYRKPYNLQTYRNYVSTHTTLSSYLYEDTLSMSKTKESEFEHRVEARPSLDTLLDSGSNAARTSERLWRKVVDSNADDDYSYVKIESKIELGHFKTKRGDLKASHYFKERVKKLPRFYDPAVYSHFLGDFGTHYFTEGKLGGIYEVFYQFKSQNLESTGTGEGKSGSCLVLDTFKRLFNGGNTTYTPLTCAAEDNNDINIEHLVQKATDSIAIVKGGFSSEAAELTYVGKNALQEIYKKWADTVTYSPTIFDFKIAPISELIEDFEIRQNIDQSLQDLYSKFDPKVCGPIACLNDGRFVVINKGRECKCICKSPYFGNSCEKRSKWMKNTNPK